MKEQTLVEWLEQLCIELDEPEIPIFRTDYSQGIADGASDTQKLIAKKIRYAIQQEKCRMKNHSYIRGKCVNCGEAK
jgi:hypothetical protein